LKCVWGANTPIPHAWVTISGKVVDLTAEAVARWRKRQGITPSDYDYNQGVEIEWKAVSENMKRTSEYGPVIDWDAKFRAEFFAQRDGATA